MDEEVAEALDGCPPLEVVTRRGSPFDAEDLAKVGMVGTWNSYDPRGLKDVWFQFVKMLN